MSLVVIIDDRVTNRNIFGRLAASIEPNIEVETFGDPAEALAWLAHRTPDLIITDYKMPQMDAAEFIRRYRGSGASIDIPIVVITVYEERSFRLQALEAGATDFLQSPVDHHEFLTRARNLLNLRRHQLLLASRATTLELELENSERSRELALRDSSERLAQVIDTLPLMISAAGYDGRILFVNGYETDFFDVDPAAVVDKRAEALLGEEAGARSSALDRMVFETGKALPSYEEERIDRTGAQRIFLTTKAPLRGLDNEVTGVLTTSIDITERKRDEAHLRHLAHHDPLTDLPNRALLGERMRALMARARRGPDMFALHMIDLDGFKTVNDLLGHSAGDRFLRGLGQKLLDKLPKTDTVARLGGDEFAILQTDVGSSDEAAAYARALIDLVASYCGTDDPRATTTASLGVAVYPADGTDPEDLLKNADLAMYKAKGEGGNMLCFYAANMQARAQQAAHLDAELRQGLAENQFLLYYQPQVNLVTGRIVGAEALVRWDRPGIGLVGPSVFLARTEENGLILPLSEWVLHEACREAKRWQRLGLPPLRVSVNLSPVQFRRRTLPLLVAKVLAETGLDPRRLDLELTESAVLEDFESVADDMQQLIQLGVSLAIDDFGTGYSSLGYVKRFPVDRIKIDQGFVRNMVTDPNDAVIVRTIMTLAHSLNIAVVAEGVETTDQLASLRAEGCDEVQGYYFGRPMPAAEFVELVRSEPALARTA